MKRLAAPGRGGATMPATAPNHHEAPVSAASGGSSEPGLLRKVFVILLVAAAYLVAGRIAILIAPPSPFPTLLWPAAGVALAALVVFGVRLWPGVWLVVKCGWRCCWRPASPPRRPSARRSRVTYS